MFSLCPVAIAKEKSMFVLVNLCDNDTINKIDFGVEEIEELPFVSTIHGNYSIILESEDGKEILKYYFDVYFEINAMEVDILTGELWPKKVKLECNEVYIRLPFFKNVSKIRILRLDKLLHEFSICNYNKICELKRGENEINCARDCSRAMCGNKRCEFGETQESCCRDCGCPHGFNCIDDKCVRISSPIIYFIIILIIGVLMTVVILTKKSLKTPQAY